MENSVRNFAIDWQDWASMQNLSTQELADWGSALTILARVADPSGTLTEELQENGIL